MASISVASDGTLSVIALAISFRLLQLIAFDLSSPGWRFSSRVPSLRLALAAAEDAPPRQQRAASSEQPAASSQQRIALLFRARAPSRSYCCGRYSARGASRSPRPRCRVGSAESRGKSSARRPPPSPRSRASPDCAPSDSCEYGQGDAKGNEGQRVNHATQHENIND